ncbi:MAG: aspartate kinase [Bulleidia sp.]|nr:aspartate kinase [Bulleidia sp.]
MSKVVKFGGSSCADAKQLSKARRILEEDSERRYLVVSAPGKRFPDDIKVTDLFYYLYDAAVRKEDTERILKRISDRYQEIIDGLGIHFDLQKEMDVIRSSLASPEREYLASRGEHLNALIMADWLGWPYVESGENIFIDEEHHFIPEKSYPVLARTLAKLDHAVIPGFYGSDGNGKIRVFTRGGSDITGAIVARAVHASLYENWTDVDGMRSADPGIISDPKPVRTISYQELRELSYMGASVLHEETVFPVRTAGIPINIRNTNHPSDPGTMIVPAYTGSAQFHMVTGIAGKKNMSNIQIDMAMMNAEIGFGAKVLSILARHGVPYEHTPTSIDTMSVLVSTKDLEPVREKVLKELNEQLHPDRVFIEDHIAVVAVVGEGIAKTKGFAAEVFQAVADADINIRMIDVSFSELNIILAVDEENYEKTITAIYEEIEDRL